MSTRNGGWGDCPAALVFNVFLKMAAAMKRIVGRSRGFLRPLLALAAVDRVVLRKIEGARIAASL
ncbi:hypothetical protein RB2083_2674 [Rhodobacteraceae bacterium HTCC2083]|nr:hypothetical protein RB2083_2674 [Rhodobacteraceae bacterium HTCC2083]